MLFCFKRSQQELERRINKPLCLKTEHFCKFVVFANDPDDFLELDCSTLHGMQHKGKEVNTLKRKQQNKSGS